MSDADATHIDTTQPLPESRSGAGLVGVALVLPVLSGILLCFVRSYPVSLGIGAATVIATAALVAIDASRLGKVDLKGRERESAGLLFLGMLGLWIAVYPLAFFRRSAFTAPNLGFLALVVAVFFLVAPFAAAMLTPVRLPSCGSAEVAQLLEQVIRSTSVGAAVRRVDGHRELSYDRDADMRQGECIAHLDSGDLPVRFVVQWQDRKTGRFQVRLAELPSCTSTEVVHLLEQVIRSTPVGAAAKAIDGHRELSHDRDADVRHGECVAHLDSGDLPIRFVVEWQDRQAGQFQVRIVE